MCLYMRSATWKESCKLLLMVARYAGRSLRERLRLLSVLVVGGGPTGVEFCGELGDFIRSVGSHDIRRTTTLESGFKLWRAIGGGSIRAESAASWSFYLGLPCPRAGKSLCESRQWKDTGRLAVPSEM